MIDPEEIPTAEAIARAVVAAARVTGENPLGLRYRTGRFRVPALTALRAFYPLCPPFMLARFCGMNDGYSATVAVARKSVWWAACGEQAVDAAMAVLEGL